jgi:hypothetical protein
MQWPVHLLGEDVSSREDLSSREDTSASWPPNPSLIGHRRTYLTILESADHALFKMERYILLRPLRPELDGKDVEASSHEDMSSSSR